MKTVTIAKRELAIIILCVGVLCWLFGGMHGAHSTRETVARTQTNAVPGILSHLQELEKDVDDIRIRIFGEAK